MNTAIRTFRGKTPVIGKKVFIDPTAVVIGDVVIGKDSSIWPMTVVRGDMNSIRIGERTSIQDGSILHITHASDYNPKGHALSIGSDVTVGHSATLHGCTIHDRVLIGIGAIVMDGAVVEEEVIVAAGCLVPPGKRLQKGFLYKGNPAKMVRPLTDQEVSFFSYSAANYVKLKDEYII
ncbi:anhydrase [Endozoicomonas montiporae]|uniref:Anhydrase n=2 Tax=Endozoicomonas montiporae TaxID=1027273 RepID=A0A081N0A2_9GAMM|nr:gamma carbonic anhydrase family protein [Endozoicomonas montiporae]AMO54327.1 anhydrase, family 3 protein [Endozoicomonas montiporae CL-33]KEQ11875.1 anhydrase [Endozoicomonas montiporae]